MRPLFEQVALPWLRRHLWPGIIRARSVIHTLGWSEAHMNETIQDLFDADPRLDVTILARSGKIDVNSAEVYQLVTLPNIGGTRAQAIVMHRETHGPFADVNDLVEVSGIGPATLEKLRNLVVAR